MRLDVGDVAWHRTLHSDADAPLADSGSPYRIAWNERPPESALASGCAKRDRGPFRTRAATRS
jgi:hypothetical protein